MFDRELSRPPRLISPMPRTKEATDELSEKAYGLAAVLLSGSVIAMVFVGNLV